MPFILKTILLFWAQVCLCANIGTTEHIENHSAYRAILGNMSPSAITSFQKLSSTLEERKHALRNAQSAECAFHHLLPYATEFFKAKMQNFPILHRDILINFEHQFSAEDQHYINLLTLVNVLSICMVHCKQIEDLEKNQTNTPEAIQAVERSTAALLAQHLQKPSFDVFDALVAINTVKQDLKYDVKFLFQDSSALSAIDSILAMSIETAVIVIPNFFKTGDWKPTSPGQLPSLVIFEEGIVHKFSLMAQHEMIGKALQKHPSRYFAWFSPHNTREEKAFLTQRSALALEYIINELFPLDSHIPLTDFSFTNAALIVGLILTDPVTFTTKLFTSSRPTQHPLLRFMSIVARMADKALSCPELPNDPVHTEIDRNFSNTAKTLLPHDEMLEAFIRQAHTLAKPDGEYHYSSVKLHQDALLQWLSIRSDCHYSFLHEGYNMIVALCQATNQSPPQVKSLPEHRFLSFMLTDSIVCTHIAYRVFFPKPTALLKISNIYEFIRHSASVENLAEWLPNALYSTTPFNTALRLHHKIRRAYWAISEYEKQALYPSSASQQDNTPIIEVALKWIMKFDAFVSHLQSDLPSKTVQDWMTYKEHFKIAI